MTSVTVGRSCLKQKPTSTSELVICSFPFPTTKSGSYKEAVQNNLKTSMGGMKRPTNIAFTRFVQGMALVTRDHLTPDNLSDSAEDNNLHHLLLSSPSLLLRVMLYFADSSAGSCSSCSPDGGAVCSSGVVTSLHRPNV